MIYKTKANGVNELTVANFEADTLKDPPYYMPNNKGVQYAMCPACGNPIQIIGLYDGTPSIRHFCFDVADLAKYIPENHDYCLYANPKRLDKKARRKSSTGIPSTILTSIRDEYQAIIRYLNAVTGLRLSQNLTRDMLKDYLTANGHMYTGANLVNYPIMLPYMSEQLISGQFIDENSRLMTALRENAPECVGSNRINHKLKLMMSFVYHQVADECETVQYVVSVDKSSRILYEEMIVFDPLEYQKYAIKQVRISDNAEAADEEMSIDESSPLLLSPTDLINGYLEKQEEELPSIAEITKAMRLHKEATLLTTKLMNEARNGKQIDIRLVTGMVAELVAHCQRSPESFISITRIKDSENYTITHSVNVAVMAISLGKRLGYSEQELHNLGFAGLLHDIGKMQIHEQILNKPGKLTSGEFTVVKMHSLKGYMYLKSVGVTENAILTAVLHHHEKADGSGYPKGMVDSQIPRFAKILSVVDVYDAITSDRVYHKGILPSDAMKLLFSWSGKRFNDALVRFFISIMGVYPSGTLIMLDTNEIAVALEPNKSASLRPTVLIVTDENMAPIEPYSFDLSSRNVATQAFHKSIVSAVSAKDFNINISQYVQ